MWRPLSFEFWKFASYYLFKYSFFLLSFYSFPVDDLVLDVVWSFSVHPLYVNLLICYFFVILWISCHVTNYFFVGYKVDFSSSIEFKIFSFIAINVILILMQNKFLKVIILGLLFWVWGEMYSPGCMDKDNFLQCISYILRHNWYIYNGNNFGYSFSLMDLVHSSLRRWDILWLFKNGNKTITLSN